MLTAKRLAVTKTALPPCCLRLDPRDPSVVLIGTYKLEKETGTRHGSIDILRIELGEFSLVSSTPTLLAILDLKFSPFDPLVVVLAHSTGEIAVWQYNGELSLVQKVQLTDDDTLVTSIFFCPHEEGKLLATLTSGESLLVDLQTQQTDQLASSHSLECWTGAFGEIGPAQNVVFTGGDDAALVAHDTRSLDKIWATGYKHHDAGVVLILCPSTKWLNLQPNTLWTGSYDDHLRILDLRMLEIESGPMLYQNLLPSERLKQNLNGGVWRLIPAPHSDDVLACCMYDGARIITPTSTSAAILRYFKGDHESMCYGGDWMEPDSVVTCSFYDNVVQQWLPSETAASQNA